MKDFITVTDKKNFYKWFSKISQKHVDFLICDKNLVPIMAIELDDKSHESEKARKNDYFKDTLYQHLNFPLRRVKAAQYYKQQEIEALFY